MKAVFNQSPVPSLLLDGNFPHFTIQHANLAYLQLNGVQETDLVGRSFFEVLSDKSTYVAERIEVLNSLTTAVYTRKPQQVMVKQAMESTAPRHWRMENTPIWGEKGELLYILQTVKDMTETVNVNLQRQEAESRYSHLFHFSPLPMWVFDIETLKFLDVNNAAIEHYGYCRGEFLKMSIREIRPLNETAKLEETVSESEKQLSCFFPDSFTHMKKNGEIIRVNIYSNIVSFQGRRAKVVIAYDITERLNYLGQIEKQNEALREIAWIQSHVVRAPLTRIVGCANLLARPDLDPEEKSKLREYLLTSAHDFDEIIKEITIKTFALDQNVPREQKTPLMLGHIPRSGEAA